MITVNLLRISPDSKYLEFSVESPISYIFNKLYIKKYDYVSKFDEDDGWRDCSHLLQRVSNKEVMRISTTALTPEFSITPDADGNSASTMFYVTFGVTVDTFGSNYEGIWSATTTYNGYEIVIKDGKYYMSLSNNNLNNSVLNETFWKELPNIEDVQGVCSDVNNVYIILKDSILNLSANCLTQNNYQELIRNYMFLYGHTESMRLERFQEAEMYYDLIKKAFKSCGKQLNKRDTPRVLNNCNCKG